MSRRLAVFLGFLIVIGCAERRVPSPFTSLAQAKMEAGVGLGTLKLEQTTLGAFTRQYGVTQSVITPEQNGAKIDFLHMGFAFLFKGDPACAQGLSAAAGGDLNAFLLQNPDCETMLLERIAAYIPPQGDAVYEGETIEGIGLNATKAMAERAYKATQDAVTALETGMPLPEQPLTPANEIYYPGIRITMGRDAHGNEVVRRLEVVPRQ